MNIKSDYTNFKTNEFINGLFNGSENVEILSLQKSIKGNGHWWVNAKIIIDGITIDSNKTTSNSRMIDEWNDEDGNISEETFTIALSLFESEIYDLIDESQND